MVVWRTLSKDSGRLLLSLAGVTLSIILMLMMQAIYKGSLVRDAKFIREINTDVFVFPRGASAYYQASTPVPLTELNEISTIQGVSRVTPIFSTRAGLERDGKIYDLYISGYTPSDINYGPWLVVSGSRTINDSEIVIPSSLAKKLDLKIGDQLKLIGIERDWTIGGLVPEGKSFGRNHSWVTQRNAEDIFPAPGFATFALVELDTNASGSSVTANIEKQFDNLSAKTKAEQIRLADESQAESFAPILNMMTAVAIVLGTLIVGIVLYSSISERRRELGVMKAIGFNTRTLVIITYTQALLLLVIGFVIALFIVLAVNYSLPRFFDFPIALTFQAVWQTLIYAFAISLLALIPSVKFISSVYPSEAFK